MERCLTVAHVRLRRALRLEFVAMTVALVASASTVVLLAASAGTMKSTVSAISACVGNVLRAGVTVLRNGLGGRNSVASKHARLATALPELAFLRGRLASYRAEAEFELRREREVSDLVARAERLCTEVRTRCAEGSGGVPVGLKTA
jgi:hypothetical protein